MNDLTQGTPRKMGLEFKDLLNILALNEHDSLN